MAYVTMRKVSSGKYCDYCKCAGCRRSAHYCEKCEHKKHRRAAERAVRCGVSIGSLYVYPSTRVRCEDGSYICSKCLESWCDPQTRTFCSLFDQRGTCSHKPRVANVELAKESDLSLEAGNGW